MFTNILSNIFSRSDGLYVIVDALETKFIPSDHLNVYTKSPLESVKFPAATSIPIESALLGVNVHTDESLDMLTMYCAESDTILWFTKLTSELSESVALAVTIKGVAESTISYVAGWFCQPSRCSIN